MKKIMSMLLTVALVFSALCLPVYAEENDPIPQDIQIRSGEDALELACEIWPEYADKLMWEDLKPMTRSASMDNPVVVQKTHQISDKESITYVEYANGFAVAAAVSNWTEDSHTSGSGYDRYVGGIYVTSGMSTAHLLGFTYQLNHADYDEIVSFGSMYKVHVDIKTHGKKKYEDASGIAYYTYQVYFTDDWGNLYGSSIVNLRVGGDQFTWSVA